MSNQHISIGVDIGARHVSCAALDLQQGETVTGSDSRLSLDSFADGDSILDTWARALSSTLSRVEGGDVAGIGFAMPGPFDYLHGVSRMEHKYPRLNGREIAQELGVAQKTIRRDLDVFREVGFPLEETVGERLGVIVLTNFAPSDLTCSSTTGRVSKASTRAPSRLAVAIAGLASCIAPRAWATARPTSAPGTP